MQNPLRSKRKWCRCLLSVLHTFQAAVDSMCVQSPSLNWRSTGKQNSPLERNDFRRGFEISMVRYETVFLFFREDVSPLHIIIIAIASTTPSTYAAGSASRLIRDLCLRAIYGSANNCAARIGPRRTWVRGDFFSLLLGLGSTCKRCKLQMCGARSFWSWAGRAVLLGNIQKSCLQ